MGNVNSCTLAQSGEGYFWDVARKLGLAIYDRFSINGYTKRTWENLFNLGFIPLINHDTTEEFLASIPTVTDAWKAKILELRNAGN